MPSLLWFMVGTVEGRNSSPENCKEDWQSTATGSKMMNEREPLWLGENVSQDSSKIWITDACLSLLTASSLEWRYFNSFLSINELILFISSQGYRLSSNLTVLRTFTLGQKHRNNNQRHRNLGVSKTVALLQEPVQSRTRDLQHEVSKKEICKSRVFALSVLSRYKHIHMAWSI